MGSESGSIDAQLEPEGPKFFFREKFAKLGVRGNFMPLAAQPKNVDLGDWLAHQGKCSRSNTTAALPNCMISTRTIPRTCQSYQLHPRS